MHRQPSKLLMVTAAAAAVVTVAAGCQARVYGNPPPNPEAPQLTVVAPLGDMAPLPEAPPTSRPGRSSAWPTASGWPPPRPQRRAPTSPPRSSTATPVN